MCQFRCAGGGTVGNAGTAVAGAARPGANRSPEVGAHLMNAPEGYTGFPESTVVAI
jgi:hypothetical protein